MCINAQEKSCKFDDFWCIYRHSITTQELKNFQSWILNIFLKVVPRLSWTPSGTCIIIGVTCRMNISTQSVCMNKPCWGSINWERILTICGYITFVTAPGAFNLDFPKNHDFQCLGKEITKILKLVCSNGPGRWVDAQRCLERDLKWSTQVLRSENV